MLSGSTFCHRLIYIYVSGFVFAPVQQCVVCKWLWVRVHVFVHAHLYSCLCICACVCTQGQRCRMLPPKLGRKKPSGKTKDLLTCWARHIFSCSNDHFCEFVKHFNHWRRKHSNVVCNAVLLPILTWLKQQTWSQAWNGKIVFIIKIQARENCFWLMDLYVHQLSG